MLDQRKAALSILLLATLLVGALLVFVVQDHAADPLAAYRTADGHITVPGGKMTPELQRLLFPGPAPTNYTVYLPDARDPHPTFRILGIVHQYSEFQSSFHPPSYADNARIGGSLLARIAAPLWDGIHGMASDIFGFFTGAASAACTGGACFWIGGTGNFSDTTHWSLLSGGVTCVCTPGSTDTVTFNTNSGSGTATEDNASFTSGALSISGAGSGTVALGANSWTVGAVTVGSSGTL